MCEGPAGDLHDALRASIRLKGLAWYTRPPLLAASVPRACTAYDWPLVAPSWPMCLLRDCLVVDTHCPNASPSTALLRAWRCLLWCRSRI
jgi:hypothetical protein